MALRLSVPAERFFLHAVQALVVLAVVFLAFRLVDIFSHWAQARLNERGRLAAISMLPPGRKTLKVFLGAVGLLAVLQNVGFNVTALCSPASASAASPWPWRRRRRWRTCSAA